MHLFKAFHYRHICTFIRKNVNSRHKFKFNQTNHQFSLSYKSSITSFSTSTSSSSSLTTPLSQAISSRIRLGGPISVADYMRYCLQYPNLGTKLVVIILHMLEMQHNKSLNKIAYKLEIQFIQLLYNISQMLETIQQYNNNLFNKVSQMIKTLLNNLLHHVYQRVKIQ